MVLYIYLVYNILECTKTKNKAILVFVIKKNFEINGHEVMQLFVTKPTVKWLIGNIFSEGGIL